MCATFEQHECLDCRRGFSHILIEMLNLIDHTIRFNLHLSTHGQQIKCCVDVRCPLILIFLSRIYIYMCIDTAGSFLYPRCAPTIFFDEHTKEDERETEREREKMTKVQASVDLIF